MFELPKLNYEYNALEPHIDARTMEIHHTKHHAGYTKKFNAALENVEIIGECAEDIVADLHNLPREIQITVRNNGGGYINHSLFWKILSPDGGGTPLGKLLEAIEETFGSFEEFKEKFSNAAKTRFGSGWGWLIVDKEKKLKICSTSNQDNPIMNADYRCDCKECGEGCNCGCECQGMPILGVDVWEHAYYLKYQNKRGEYLDNFWNVVNWDEVAKRFERAIS